MQTLVAEILAAWRRADRLTRDLEPGSPEHSAAASACERLRDLYRELTTSGVAEPLNEAEARALLAELADAASDTETAPP